MKNNLWLPVGILALALSSCTGDGVPVEEFEQTQKEAKKLRMQVEELEEKLKKSEKKLKDAEAAPEDDGKEELETQIDSQLKEIEEKQEALDTLKQEFRDYKSKYRIGMRGKWIGKEIAKIETNEGEVFEQVVVKDFSAVGIRVTHSGGTGRIRFENLDEEFQNKLGYDKEEADAILAKELAAKAEIAAKVAEAKEALVPTPGEAKTMSVSALEYKISKLAAWVERASAQRRAIKREALDFEAKARFAKSRGRVSYWGPKAEEKKRAAAALERQVKAASSELSDLRRQLRTAKRPTR